MDAKVELSQSCFQISNLMATTKQVHKHKYLEIYKITSKKTNPIRFQDAADTID